MPFIQKLKKKIVTTVVSIYTKNRVAYFDSSMENHRNHKKILSHHYMNIIVFIKTLIIK